MENRSRLERQIEMESEVRKRMLSEKKKDLDLAKKKA
jgi:hypothetical protein